MGENIESYKMVLELQIKRWSGFARALRRAEREAFDELVDVARTTLLRAAMQPTP